MTGEKQWRKNQDRAYAFAVDGNTARRLKDPDMEERLRSRDKRRREALAIRNVSLARLQEEKKLNAHRMSRLNKLFWVAATAVCVLAAIGYLKINDENTRSVKQISALESELNTLKLKNDEAQARITGNVDLEEIRRIAIYELGMQYADEGQVVKFKDNGGDYVRQFQDIEAGEKPSGKPEAQTR